VGQSESNVSKYMVSKNSSSSNYMDLRKSYASSNIAPNENYMKYQKGRLSESTKPSRPSKVLGKTPSKVRYSRARASSNPRLGSNRENQNMSSSYMKGRKGRLMSSSRLGKIIADQSNAIFEQKERIKKIYEPNSTGLQNREYRIPEEFPSINNKHLQKAVDLANQKIKNPRGAQGSHKKIIEQMNKTEERIISDTSDSMINPNLLKRVTEGLLSTEIGRRENIGVEEFIHNPRKDATSHSLLGNLEETDYKVRRDSSKDNSTFSINAKKHNMMNGYDPSLSNLIKYDTTAVISEERSNLDDPFTQMFSNTILTG
jgi:hypothetical protein